MDLSSTETQKPLDNPDIPETFSFSGTQGTQIIIIYIMTRTIYVLFSIIYMVPEIYWVPKKTGIEFLVNQDGMIRHSRVPFPHSIFKH